jgi:hypothetical protein
MPKAHDPVVPQGVGLPRSLWLRAKARAKAEGRSTSSYIARLIEADLATDSQLAGTGTVTVRINGGAQ